MKQAWLVVNAFLQGQSFARMETLLTNAAAQQGVSLITKTNAEFIREASLNAAPHAAIFLDKDIKLAQRMENKGMRLFNSAAAIAVCDDKTLSTLAFEHAGIPQPKTILCPMTFPNIGYPTLDFLDEVAQVLGFPMVVKEGKGSFGQQVYLAHNMDELTALMQEIGPADILFQQFVAESAGRDLRLYVVGDEVVAAIMRVNQKDDFRANIEHGGIAFAHTPTQEEASLALAASAACGTDFAGVDLLLGKDGPLVCEVNSNAHFLGLMEATGINPAVHITKLLKDAL
ncbi:MAG TPA: RimK family alpha-L-glutamate ligase [Clostridiales bacterium]|jgi:RimK family alpha-L-glutamate ligase|nr:RimK family alpha-L-glutamate ligase [Clostridiales bacterium]